MPGTLNQLFFEALERFNRPDAYQVRRGGKYEAISHATVLERVGRIALGLQELGFARDTNVAILSENRPEWAFADWACLTIGIADVPVYPTLPAAQVKHILENSGATAIFVSGDTQAAKIAEIRAQLPRLAHVITFAATKPAGVDLTLAEIESRGSAVDAPARRTAWKAGALSVKPGDLATLIYTSGTTGLPKGVMLTHDNIHSNVMTGARVLPFTLADVALSFLPLSHIFERVGDYVFWTAGVSVAYAESIDTVPLNMTEVRPTLCMSVPRLYEKMYAKVLESAAAGPPLKQRIFAWARAVANVWADEKLAGREPRGVLAVKYAIAQKLVFAKLRARTGGRLRYFVSGGAPLAPEINKFFYAAGLVILEGYGLTETSPVIACNTPEALRIGTVGRPFPGVDVRIAPDGEIVVRGPNVMAGYYQNEEATREAIDADGWFHTGDIGVLEDGFLKITDRKKDIIVTAGGKNIAPQPIENSVKTNRFVAQAVLIGDRRKFPVLLVVPNWEQLEPWAKRAGISWSDRASLLTNAAIVNKMDDEVRATLTGLAKFESPKKIALLEHDFSIERGELTPTLKVKRRVIDRDYKELIDSLYEDRRDARIA